MSWFKNKDGVMAPGADNANVDDVEFKPDKFKAELTGEFKTQLDTLKTEFASTLKPLNDMALQIAEDRKNNTERARRAAEQKTAEEGALTTEDYILDPQGATRREMQPLAIATMKLNAKVARGEYLANKEYYHGDVKSKVDAMIENQPLSNQARADVVENCYKLILFDYQKDIAEGKLKARNTSGIFEGGSTGGHAGDKTSEETDSLSADEKFVAAKMGISDKDWIKSRKELSYV